MIDLRELLLGEPHRLSFVIRFSTTRISRQETVAEHSFYVAFYSMIILEWLEATAESGLQLLSNQQKYECLSRALLHDMEECRTGDFPRPFKYSDPKMKELLDQASETAVFQTVYRLTDGENETDKVISEFLTRMWKSAKDSTQSGKIVKFADFLSVLSYLCDEVAVGNKKTLLRHTDTMAEYLETFKSREYDFIRPLVDQADDILDSEFENG